MKFSQSSTDVLQTAISNLKARHAASITNVAARIDELQYALSIEKRRSDSLRDALNELTEEASRETYGRRREIGLRLTLLAREERIVEGLRRWKQRMEDSLQRRAQAEPGHESFQEIEVLIPVVIAEADKLLSMLDGPFTIRHSHEQEGTWLGSFTRMIAAEEAVKSLLAELQVETDRRLALDRWRVAQEDSASFVSTASDIFSISAPAMDNASLTSPPSSPGQHEKPIPDDSASVDRANPSPVIKGAEAMQPAAPTPHPDIDSPPPVLPLGSADVSDPAVSSVTDDQRDITDVEDFSAGHGGDPMIQSPVPTSIQPIEGATAPSAAEYPSPISPASHIPSDDESRGDEIKGLPVEQGDESPVEPSMPASPIGNATALIETASLALDPPVDHVSSNSRSEANETEDSFAEQGEIQSSTLASAPPTESLAAPPITEHPVPEIPMPHIPESIGPEIATMDPQQPEPSNPPQGLGVPAHTPFPTIAVSSDILAAPPEGRSDTPLAAPQTGESRRLEALVPVAPEPHPTSLQARARSGHAEPDVPPPPKVESDAPSAPLSGTQLLLAQLEQVAHRYDSVQRSFRDCNVTLTALKSDINTNFTSPPTQPTSVSSEVLRTAVGRLEDFNEDARVELEIRIADEARLAKGYETVLSVPGALVNEKERRKLVAEVTAFVEGTSEQLVKAQETFKRKLDDLQHDIAALKLAIHENVLDQPTSVEAAPPQPVQPTPQRWSSWTPTFLSPSRPTSPSPTATFGSVMTSHRSSTSSLRSPSSPVDPFARLGLRISMPSASGSAHHHPTPLFPSAAPFLPRSRTSSAPRLPALGGFLQPSPRFERPRTLSGMYFAGLGGAASRSKLSLGADAPSRRDTESGIDRASEVE
ncbi:hypothetical protein BOTBODRAFT_396929 [Botryobasidium botryosum FD-172 SS1]|uniref:Uncharacterized protein n=1 Tax=Botryobasidium botryosum (strain FD-172 SS1) TaxID=930990 RepID=A0A067MMP6_BOTB1|nr:hypothetical protein BOTBODRAFT_396929 [Botryobasidium botryosum FD-172 SS1]